MDKRPAGISISPSNMEEATKVKPHLQKYVTRLQKLDTNKDQIIELDELCEAIDEMVTVERQRRLLIWIAAFFAIFAVLVTAAIVGLTYAVLELSKDTKVENNILVTKKGDPLTMGKYSLTILPADPSEQDIIVTGGSYVNTTGGGRRLMQAGESAVACYRNDGRLEDFAIRALCDRVNGNDLTFIMKLKDKACRTDDAVEVGEDWQALTVEGDPVCPYELTEVKVSKHACQLLNETPGAIKQRCKEPIDDAVKNAKTHNVIYALGVNNGKNYVIEWKCNCGSLTAPTFQNWFESGQLRTQIECPP